MKRTPGPDQLGFDLDGAAPAAAPEPAGAAPAAAPAAPTPPAVSAPARGTDAAALPDQAARATIAGDLDLNLLVEAGAGSGKTFELVTRMVALVRGGRAQVHEIAAVTFTRKAAGELRQRFQEALEKERLEPTRSEAERTLLDQALRDIDRSFMGTIHAFCARLLRERPIEAGLDPAFAETTAAEAVAQTRRFWSLHLERLATAGDPILGELEDVGLKTAELLDLYEELTEFSDVVFPLEQVAPPDPAAVARLRTELEALMHEAGRMMPESEPPGGWDPMQARLNTLAYKMRHGHGRWRDDRFFLDALGAVSTEWELTQNRWADDSKGKAAAKAMCQRFNDFLAEGSAAERVLDQWWAHRYPTAMRFAKGAADALIADRRQSGRLDFQDLLVLAAQLLRTQPLARADLGARWKRILVDEFQDTDPLQAEVLFLLASDSNGDSDWSRAVPRPGALFVVGDPKQSIYRFRRADISLYGRVRERFEGFGSVVRLTANFRSGPPIAELVNDVFAPPDGFPETGNDTQAAFARLEPQPRKEPASLEGVYHFTAAPATGHDWAIAEWESEAIAEWIAARIASEERTAGEFLVLTRTKKALFAIARACEARGLPIQVSGAGVRAEREVGELILLLRALSDPADPSLTVAVLIGMFFGLDHEQLLVHREAGLSFDLRRADRRPVPEAGPVEVALARLRGWWDLARAHPADAVVGTIADDLGLMAHAAAGELGSIRAGALAYALDAVRASGLEGDTSLAGALDALAAALAEDEAEAPLEPGRKNVVRLMNLHKAKGLEAPVVVLAEPYGFRTRDIVRAVERGPDGRARGWMMVHEQGRFGKKGRIIARPLGWAEREARERHFRDAEELRLLYVAATRAGHELIVSRSPKSPGVSPWGGLDAWLRDHGIPMDLEPTARPPRAPFTETAASMATRVADALAARGRAAETGYRFTTVTRLVKTDTPPSADLTPLPTLRPTSSGPGGYEWGSAVHGVLDVAARGAAGDRLRAVGRTLLLELDRPARGGEPTELDALMATVEGVRKTGLWKRAQQSPRRLSEVPFALGLGDDSWLEGVVDLAFREADGWVLADYKTDKGTDPAFAARRLAYRAQLQQYGLAWARLTGERVTSRVIVWVHTGQEEQVPA